MELMVYLAGHIHGDWRKRVAALAAERHLPIRFAGPRQNHGRSDSVGEDILGPQPHAIARDELGSAINGLRTRVLMAQADVVLAFFEESPRQWNTASDAALAQGLGLPVIVVRDPGLHHALKEVAQRADVVVETLEQAVAVLGYIFEED